MLKKTIWLYSLLNIFLCIYANNHYFFSNDQLFMGATSVTNTYNSTAIIHNPALLTISGDKLKTFDLTASVSSTISENSMSKISFYNPLIQFGTNIYFGYFIDIYSLIDSVEINSQKLINFQYNRHRLYTLGFSDQFNFAGLNYIGISLQYKLIDSIYDKYTGNNGVSFYLNENNIALNLSSLYYGVSYKTIRYDGIDFVIGYAKPISFLPGHDVTVGAVLSNVLGQYKGKKSILSEYVNQTIHESLNIKLGLSFKLPGKKISKNQSKPMISIDYDMISEFDSILQKLHLGLKQNLFHNKFSYSVGYVHQNIVFGAKYKFLFLRKNKAEINVGKSVFQNEFNEHYFYSNLSLNLKFYFN